jgi:hypothetical protein
VKIEISAEELSIIMDGLAQLPLAKSYNLFGKLMLLYQEEQRRSQQSPPTSAEATGSGELA